MSEALLTRPRFMSAVLMGQAFPPYDIVIDTSVSQAVDSSVIAWRSSPNALTESPEARQSLIVELYSTRNSGIDGIHGSFGAPNESGTSIDGSVRVVPGWDGNLLASDGDLCK